MNQQEIKKAKRVAEFLKFELKHGDKCDCVNCEGLTSLIQLAQDYLAISDNKLLPKEKNEKETTVAGNGRKYIVYNPNAIGSNTAIHECRLRMIKNLMTEGEICKIIDDWDEADNDEIATAIFEAMKEKMKGGSDE